MHIIIKLSFIFTCCWAFVMNFAEFMDPTSTDLKVTDVATTTKNEAICRYCICERHSKTVICNSAKHIYLKIISLPEWAETFYAHNLTTMLELPHFTYHVKLRVLRINFCQLRYVHPLSLISLPQLETIHLANNRLETIPENFLRRSTKLRILNLSGNLIRDLDEIEWSLPNGLILEELNLNDNPIELSSSAQNKEFPWPFAKQLYMENCQLESVSSNNLIFKVAFNILIYQE